MSSKNDPKHVERFTLEPIGCWPNPGNAGDLFAIASPGLHAQAFILCKRIKIDRKSTRLNSSHGYISYAVFCLKKKKHKITIVIHDYNDNDYLTHCRAR